MPLRNSQVAHISRLARLKLTPEEIDRLSSELAVIVGYFNQIKAVSTGSPGLDETRLNVLRDDTVEHSLPTEKALGNVPRHDGMFVLVPRVLPG